MKFERAGGTISNLYAVLAARYRKYPRVKSEGLQSLPGPLVMFTSEHVREISFEIQSK
jgi:glutamate/tyrosine decarboxylase-like PLP-dependent enzyme